MLSITPAAEQAIEQILDSPQAPDEAGVRIEAQSGEDGTEAGFQLAVVPSPADDDQVLAEGNVFLEKHTADLLDDSELDAEVDEGQVRFKLQHQDGGQEA